MLHTKFQGHWPFGYGEEDFLRFLQYIGMVAILVMWPGPYEHTFIPPSHGDSIWNLASISLVVSEEKMFKEWGRRTDRHTDDGSQRPTYPISSALVSSKKRKLTNANFMLNVFCKLTKHCRVVRQLRIFKNFEYLITPGIKLKTKDCASENYSKNLKNSDTRKIHCTHKQRWLCHIQPGAVARLDVRSSGMRTVAGSKLTSSKTFFRWDLVMKKFLWSFSPFRWFKKASCQLLAKEWTLMHQSFVTTATWM